MKIKDYISKYDPTLQFNVLKESYKQIEYAQSLDISNSYKSRKFESIIVSGMGGSAISADLIKNYLQDELKIPFIVNRSYNLPSFASKSLVIISSYSGNTEESLSVLEQAIEKKCAIICITTGGKVKKTADEHNLPCYMLKPGMQPRYSLAQSFFTLLRILENSEVIPPQSKEIDEILKLWKVKGEQYESEGNSAFSYAEQLAGFIPVIYSAVDLTDAAGYRFKCQLNENSKVHAFHNILPEFNHNEIIGWESYNPKDFRVKVINIKDRLYTPQINRRFEIVSGLITAKEVEILNLESNESSFKLRLFDLIYLIDWVTYYLAVIRGFDPVEIDYINTLKDRLS